MKRRAGALKFPPPLDLFYQKFQEEFEKKLQAYSQKKPASALEREAFRTLLSPAKRLRPFLAFLAYRGLGGKMRAIFDLCLALELFHTFCLIQDDGMDRSPTRRGKETFFFQQTKLHRRSHWHGEESFFGKDMAMLAGDYALVLASEPLASLDNPELFQLFQMMAKEVLEGQRLDLLYSVKPNISVGEALQMLLLKSGRYSVTRPLQLGACLAGRAELQGDIASFGDPLGIAFQMQDDFLSLFGEETGKGVREDILGGKKTLLLLETLKRAPRAVSLKLQALLHTEVSGKELAFFRATVKEYGLPLCEKRKKRLVKESLRALSLIPFSERAAEALEAFAHFLVERRA